jgi:phosphatidylserine/phosphatidylglycerophosphate/cardiolipin synthase-like enzyme
LLPQLREAVPSKAIDGVPDLMHHKYVVRDRTDVWTGSANWTDASWEEQENIVIVLRRRGLAEAFARDFEQLWRREEVEGTGTFDDDVDEMRFAGTPLQVRALFAPGRGHAISQLYARRIGQAGTRVRVCSPVLTSTPILATLAEVVDDGGRDVRVVVDGPMHAKVVVCDDVTLTGSYNCSHSGEQNAENIIELRSDAFADRAAAFVDDVFERYPAG